MLSETDVLTPVRVTGPRDGLELIVKDRRLQEVDRKTVENGAATFALAPGNYQFSLLGEPGRARRDSLHK